MAFTPDTLSLVVDSIGGGAVSIWSYRTADDEATVLAPDYMVKAGRDRRLRDGDVILVYSTAASDVYLARVVSVNAAGDASLAIDMGLLAEFEKNASVEAAFVSPIIKALRTQGYYEAGDGGDALYKGVDVEPSHGLKIQSEDGRWWARPITPFTIFEAGARGDGVTDDTAAFQLAADAPHPWCYVPDGEFHTDPIIVTEKKRLEFGADAVMKQRSVTAGQRALLRFNAGSQGSVLTGGIFDGNRAELAELSESQADVWNTIWIATDNITIKGIAIREACRFALWAQAANYLNISDVLIYDANQAFTFQLSRGSKFNSILCRDIGNTNENSFQHGGIFRFLEDCTSDDVRFLDFAPETGLDPFAGAIHTEWVERCHFSRFVIDGYEGASAYARGLTLNGFIDSTIDGFVVRGYPGGLTTPSLIGSVVKNFILDGDKKIGGGEDNGIMCREGGVRQAGASSELDYRATQTGHRSIFANGLVKNFAGTGVVVRGQGLDLVNVHSIGNGIHGFSVAQAFLNTTVFPGGIEQANRDIHLIDCAGRYNAAAGALIAGGDGIVVRGGTWDRNGWNTGAAGNQRAGISIQSTDPVSNVHIDVNRWDDDQGETFTNLASFIPGSSDDRDRFTIWSADPGKIELGQRITLKDATAGGDIVGQVIRKDVDSAVLQFSAPATLIDTGNLVALTGTVEVVQISAGQSTMTGSGTAFQSELKGRVVVKVGGNYAPVQKVLSDTEAVLGGAINAAAGATAEIVAVDVQTTRTQQYSLYTASGVVGPVSFRNHPAGSIGIRTYQIDNIASLADGQEFWYENRNQAFSTSNATTGLQASMPAGLQPLAWKFQITEEVTGTDGTFAVDTFDGSTLTQFVTGLGLTVNTKGSGGILSQLFSATTNFRATLSGGSDNIASGGRCRAAMLVRKLKPADYPNV